MDYSRQAIVQTLLYSDIFSFPLTREELWRYLITTQPLTRQAFDAALASLVRKEVICVHGYYALAGKKEYILTRKKNLGEVQKKLRIAKLAAYYLSYIPSILFIGVSGGVAVGNADSTSDVDLFIITKKRTLYITRLWVLAMLELLQLRRKKGDQNPADKVCVNLFLDERDLMWAEEKQDIFVAHEIAQLKPLFHRKNMFHSFLLQNQWIRNYLPHSTTRKPVPGDAWNRTYLTLSVMSSLVSFAPWEYAAKLLQRFIMRRGRTVEVVTGTMLAFHPIDYRLKTLHIWQKASQELGLLTNK